MPELAWLIGRSIKLKDEYRWLLCMLRKNVLGNLHAQHAHVRGAIPCDTTSVPDCIKIRHLGSRAVYRHGHSNLRTYKDREFLKVVASKYFVRKQK
jgi:hypothetical protein